MRILLINHQVRPELSGVASHFESISKNLLALKHQVIRLVTTDDQFKEENNGVSFFYFDYAKKLPDQTEADNELRIANNYSLFEKALLQIDLEKIDLVITSNDIYLTTLKKYIATKKLVAIIPSSLTFSSKSNVSGYKSIIKRIKKNTKDVKIVVLSEKMKGMLQKLLGKNYSISVIPPGVDLDKFCSSNSRNAIKNNILYVGRLAKEKNLGDLIMASSYAKISHTLTIVGSGSSMEEIKEMANKFYDVNKKIIFTGRKDNVCKYYSKADIFILPSKYEAFGLVILEAMASGLPVIAFKPSADFITASDEIISHGIDGFLVKDSEEMAEKIDLLLTDRKLLAKMSKNALLKAGKFNWTNHVKQLIAT